MFSSSALFLQALAKAKSLTRMAIASVNKIIAVSKSNRWYTKETTFQLLAVSMFCYCIEIWGLRYVNDIDKIQITYYKRILDLPKYYANYAVRNETQVSPLSSEVLSRVFNWVMKLNNVEENRLLRICFNRLVDLAIRH